MAMAEPRPQWRKLYGTARWVKLRAAHLAEHPLCAWCQEQGVVRAAEVVDHSIAHKGNESIFFDPTVLLALCKPHHDGAAQARDKNGRVRGCDVNGFPRDPNHPWNRETRGRTN